MITGIFYFYGSQTGFFSDAKLPYVVDADDSGGTGASAEVAQWVVKWGGCCSSSQTAAGSTGSPFDQSVTFLTS